MSTLLSAPSSSVSLPASVPLSQTTATTTSPAGPSPASHPTASSGTSAVQVITLIVAAVAVVLTGISIYFVRRTGRETSGAANRAAGAAEKSAGAADRAADATTESAQAASKSAQAAQDSVQNGVRSAGAAEKAADAAQASAASSERSADRSAKRAEEDSRTRRHLDAADQLGSDKAIVRMAGVYAMGALADDWEENRQQIIDVLCGYLRLPLPDSATDPGEHQVRASLVRLISEHVKRRELDDRSWDDGPWSDYAFSFADADLNGFALDQSMFRKEVSFAGATFTGRSTLLGPVFAAGASFHGCHIAGDTRVVGVGLTSSLDLSSMHIDKDTIFDVGIADNGTVHRVDLTETVVAGQLQLLVHPEDGNVKVWAPRVVAGEGSFVAISAPGIYDGGVTVGWLGAESWTVADGAIIWLPPECEGEVFDWMNTSVPASASINYGDPQANF